MSTSEIIDKKNELVKLINSGEATLTDVINLQEWNHIYEVVITLACYAKTSKSLSKDEARAHFSAAVCYCRVVSRERMLDSKEPNIQKKREAGQKFLADVCDKEWEKGFSYSSPEEYSSYISNFLLDFSNLFQAWRFAFIK